MAEACQLIREFTASRSLIEDEGDPLLRSAVERQFQIAGEALFQISRHPPEPAARIDGHQRIIGFRRILVHGYDAVRDEVVWGIVLDFLPALQRQVTELLEEASRSEARRSPSNKPVAAFRGMARWYAHRIGLSHFVSVRHGRCPDAVP
jgi:uncharacterized protein with HEPN domain